MLSFHEIPVWNREVVTGQVFITILLYIVIICTIRNGRSKLSSYQHSYIGGFDENQTDLKSFKKIGRNWNIFLWLF